MADQVVTKFQEDVKHLDMFLYREKVPLALKKSVMEYWKYQWKRTGGWSVRSIQSESLKIQLYRRSLRLKIDGAY